MATARMETTRGPTYSLTIAIGATPCQNGFICRCHCLRCHYSPQWESLVTWTNLSDGHMAYRWACQWECHPGVDTSCKAHGLLDPCACSNNTDRAWHACWTIPSLSIWPDPLCVAIVHTCRFCFIYCGLRFYAQSHSDNGHVYATAHWREDRLQQQRQAMKDNYDQICSKNQKLMHCLPGSRKTRERKSKRWSPEGS